jgi:predicted dehydrogenase
MDRRQFITATTATGISLAAAAATRQRLIAEEVADQKPKRVGLIGCGWYGKSDLFRLMQVAPVEVVSLCDVDSKQREKAANIVSQRRPQSKEKPRLYGDYREMLKEKDLDICLIGTPDHWHALTMIAACEAGPMSIARSRSAWTSSRGRRCSPPPASTAASCSRHAAPQHAAPRRSREKIVKPGLLGKIGYAEVFCYYHMRANGNPPEQPVPDTSITKCGPARPAAAYDGLPHKRWWRTFMEYGNGIVGDMCIHMLDMIRWHARPRLATQISSTGGILVQKEGKSNIADTQAATFDFGDLQGRLAHRTWGNPPDADYPGPASSTATKARSAQRQPRGLHPAGQKEPTMSGTALFDPEDKYPEDKTEEEIELHVATPANRGPPSATSSPPSPPAANPIADIEQGHISTATASSPTSRCNSAAASLGTPAKHEVAGDAEANKLLARTYRKPWVHP